MVKLNLDVVDSDEELELPKAALPPEREGLRPDKTPIAHGQSKGMMGGLIADSHQAEEARLEKERWAQEVLGSGDRGEKMVRFNTTGLLIELDHLYAGAMVRAGDVEGSGSSPHDFVFEFRGERKHISQVPLACLQFVRCVRGGADFLSPHRDDSLPSDRDVKFAMSAISNGELVAELSQLLEARCKAEQELVKFKDLLDHSQRMNNDLIADQDALNSRVADLTSVLAEAEEMKKKEVSWVEGEVTELKSSTKDAVARVVSEEKNKAMSNLRKSLEIMEERSRAQTEVHRLASLANELWTSLLRRVLTTKPRGPKQTVDSPWLGRPPALTRAEIEEAAVEEAEDDADLLELQGDEGIETVEPAEGEVAELKSSSKDAVARAVTEAKKKARSKLRKSLKIMEERSRAQTEVDRLASLASQAVGAIRRIEKATKDGVPVNTAKKEKLEARLAGYNAVAESIVLPPVPEDSSEDEEVEPARDLALDISYMERTEVDGRLTMAGKTR
ncbi:hypothetical protein AALP_AAs74635U001400 [Arabis alpina]|uniref:Uncharacterized protein n=1 Tax=Arabis alpina TaxID=50452 RepID=A0A087G0C2_ARAAL|nr:hypothetical protein AALP_AAs74635U001400 [Arabis alpina]